MPPTFLTIAALALAMSAAPCAATDTNMKNLDLDLSKVTREIFYDIPGLVIAVGIGQVFLALGLAYSIPAVILVQIVGTLPLMIRLMTAALETIPDELVHAPARPAPSPMSSCRSRCRAFLPGLMSFIGSFEEFDKSFIVGAPVVETLPIRLCMYLDPYSMQLPLAAIVFFILLLPALIVFIIAGRILRDDVMAAGMGKI
jgi:ABC-type spermidine/putrescine transport system permease subunit II